MGAIVVGYDGTAGAQAALLQAAELARDLGDRVVLVFSYRAPAVGGEVADLAREIDQHGHAVLEHGRARLLDSGVEVEVRQATLEPAEGLIRAADELDARMIVIGSAGEAPLKGALLGSTPYRLLHRSERPVLVVRAPQ